MNILAIAYTFQFYAIFAGLIAFLIIIGLVIFLSNKKNKPLQPSLSLDYLNQLYDALGGSANILSITSEHRRLQVKVDQMKTVDAIKLKTLEIPAFVKGKLITLLIKNHTQDVLSFLNDRRKEDS